MSLNLSSEPASSKKSKGYKKALRVGGAISLVGVGSTFAANISLNDGNNVEFGQGVAQTAACDSDGFFISPVSSYDNVHGIFRLDEVQISGLDLTPEGTGWDNGNLNGAYIDQAAAKSAHPGQYYNGTAWIRTCDNVVLDFRAYTDLEKYAGYTEDGYLNFQTTSTSSPVMWSQFNGAAPTQNNSGNLRNPGYAVVFDVSDTNNSYDSNKAANGLVTVNGDSYEYANVGRMNSVHTLNHSTPAQSSFIFYSDYDWRPDAGSISKITVSSMKYFPSSYQVDDSGLGVIPSP